MRRLTSHWIAIMKRVFGTYQSRDLNGLAQQTAYNILFSLAPLLIALLALAGLVTRRVNSGTPRPADPVVNWVYEHVPREAADFLKEPLERALTASPTFLLSFGGVLTLWAAKGTMSAFMKGLNAAYEVDDDRSWIQQQAIAVGLTLAGGVLLGLASLTFVLGTSVGDTIARSVGLGTAWANVSSWLRWPVIAIGIVLTIALMHRYAQTRDWSYRSFLPGAVFTVIAIVLSAIALQVYFQSFSSYDRLYGTFGSVLVFIFWAYVTSLIVLLGGALNLAMARESADRDGGAMNEESE